MFQQTLPLLLGCIRLHVLTAFGLQWITEQNAPTKQSFWDIKRDFIEQNENVFFSWDSCDCNHMNILKGK
jgi:hypothetical protein